MAKHPDDRPRSADAFLIELEEVAIAAYGPGWEERGRVRLAALAALLASMFPMSGSTPVAATALALTRLGRRRLAMVTGALVAAVVAGGGGAVVLAGVHHSIGAHSSATSSPVAAPAPSTSSPDSPSPTPSPTDSTPPETTPPPTTRAPDHHPGLRPGIPAESHGTDHPQDPPDQGHRLKVRSHPLGTVHRDGHVHVTGPGKVTVSATFTSRSHRQDTGLAAAATGYTRRP